MFWSPIAASFPLHSTARLYSSALAAFLFSIRKKLEIVPGTVFGTTYLQLKTTLRKGTCTKNELSRTLQWKCFTWMTSSPQTPMEPGNVSSSPKSSPQFFSFSWSTGSPAPQIPSSTVLVTVLCLLLPKQNQQHPNLDLVSPFEQNSDCPPKQVKNSGDKCRTWDIGNIWGYDSEVCAGEWKDFGNHWPTNTFSGSFSNKGTNTHVGAVYTQDTLTTCGKHIFSAQSFMSSPPPKHSIWTTLQTVQRHTQTGSQT